MSGVFTFGILGLASGALYVLLSLGLVIIHRVSKIVNYAQGAIGMVGTYIFWDLNQRHHVSYGLAVIVGLLVSALIGLLTERLIMRPLRDAAPVTRMIATLGLLTVLEQGIARHYDTTTINVLSELPTSTVKIFGATIGWNQLIIVGIALLIAGGLAVLYQGTQFGRLTAAAAENPRSLELLGHPPNRIAAANWAISGALAGAAGILLAPLTGLDVTQFTLLVLPALAGAVVGRLTSFPLTVLGGLVIGVIQSEMSRYISQPGWSGAAPFIVIVLLLVLRGRDEGLRSRAAERLPRLGTGRIRPVVVVLSVAIVAVLVETISVSWTDAVITTITSAVILLSLVVVTGYSGQLSLAQFAFAGWGAWVAGQLVSAHGVPIWAAALIGIAAALPLGLIVGIVCLRTQGINLSIATLAFAVGLEQMLFDNPAYTGGLGGVNVGEPHLFGIDVNSVLHNDRYALVCLAVFVIAALGVANIRRGRSGRRLLAVRANERAAASLGIDVVTSKLYAFCIASVIAAAGGILLAFRNSNVVYSTFDASTSITQVSQAVVGGIGWLGGPLAGGLLTVGSLGTSLLNLLGPGVAVYLPLVGGLLLLLTIVTAPDGIAYDVARQLRALGRILRVGLWWPRRSSGTGLDVLGADLAGAVGADDGTVGVPPRTLDVRDVGVSYGGVRALIDVSLTVRPGEVVGLIGPNGAGKTTFIDAVTGFVRPAGSVSLDGVDIRGWRPTRLAKAGLGRSFQSLELFDDMSVLDNLRVATEPQHWWSYLTDLVFPRTPPLTPIALAAVREFGLAPYLGHRPSDLPYGLRRLVGIARAVAAAPSVLLLDEPAAGLDDHESQELGSLIRRLAEPWGMAVLLVEHDVELVMSVCDRIVALDFGRQIASGTPAEIRRSPEVIESYLGASGSAEKTGPSGRLDDHLDHRESRMTAQEDFGPLAGLRVVELSTGTAGRIAGMLLADLGADVVVAVPPGDRPASSERPADVCYGRGKRRVEALREEILDLATRADVLLVGQTPAEIAELRLTSEEVKAAAPNVVHVWMPPYAEKGEWCDLPDDGLLLAALTGHAVNLPADDTSPVAPVVSILTSIHGALGAAAAIAAVIGRIRQGCVQPVAVTGLHAGAALLGVSYTEINDGPAFYPSRAIVPAPNWRPYACADGKRVFLATLTPHLFHRALEELRRPDIMKLPEVDGDFKSILDLSRGRNAVTREMEPIFAAAPSEEWLTRFREARVPCAPVQSRAEWLAGPVVAANDATVVLDHPSLGPVTMPNAFVAYSETPGRVRGFLQEAGPEATGWAAAGAPAPPRPGPGPLPLPLDGVKVLDVSSYFAAPFAATLLTDFGADVVRVEPPTGDPYREYPLSFLATNQRKRGMELDLADPAARSVVQTMLGGVDVLVENLRPRARERLDLADTATRHPRLVHCSVSAYGRAEQWADMPGFDPILQSLSGLAAAQGGDGEPVTTSAGVNDSGTGALAAMGILAALYRREQTRRGQRLWCSLAVTSLFLQAAEFTSWPGSPAPQEGRELFRGPAEGHRYYECADGWIATAAIDAPATAAMLEALGVSDFAAAGAELRGLTVAEATSRLAHHGVPACRVVPRVRPLLDPFLEANGFSHLLPVPGGTARVVDRFSRWADAVEPRAARYFGIGEDSAAIRREFGIGSESTAAEAR